MSSLPILLVSVFTVVGRYGCVLSVCMCDFFFFKQKTAYEMRISDWSSDVCSSDLQGIQSAVRCRRQGGKHIGNDAQCLLAVFRLPAIVGLYQRQRDGDRKSVV